MFALICDLPSSSCGWLRLINNNSSWLGRNNSPKNKAFVNQEGPWWWETEGGGNHRFPCFRVFWCRLIEALSRRLVWGMFKGERRSGNNTRFHSGGSMPLMCPTSSSHAALIQEVSAAGREGSPDTTGLMGKGATQERRRNWTLECSSGKDSYSCNDHTTSHMYSRFRDRKKLSGELIFPFH